MTAETDGTIRDIGSRTEIFIDDWLIERLDGGRLELQHPEPQEVAMVFDRPWEGNCSSCATVLQDGEGGYLMYYRGAHTVDGSAIGVYNESDFMICRAESADGIHWERPRIGIHEYGGSMDNNIVMAADAGGDDFAVFRDENPAAPPAERFKAGSGRMDFGLYAFASPDGIQWELISKEPLYEDIRGYDWTQSVFWDGHRNRYAAYLRGWGKVGGGEVMNLKITPPKKRFRHIRLTTSPDFRTWSDPELVEMDHPPTPEEQLYTCAMTPYARAPHLLIGFPKRYMPGRQANFNQPETGLSDMALISSRDGHRFKRWPEAFHRPGREIENWVQRNNSAARGLLQTASDELSIYWIEHYHQTEPSRLRRGTLRVDGFAAVHAGAAGGELLTRPFTFDGRELVLNYATSAYGSLQVELQDLDGQAIEGYRLAECPLIYGDEIEHKVSWEGGTDLRRLAGSPVRLRVRLRDADLYSLRFSA